MPLSCRYTCFSLHETETFKAKLPLWPQAFSSPFSRRNNVEKSRNVAQHFAHKSARGGSRKLHFRFRLLFFLFKRLLLSLLS